MAQKLDAGAGKKKSRKSLIIHLLIIANFPELYSIDGAIRVISDDFSIALLNPDSELYQYKAEKYTKMVIWL